MNKYIVPAALLLSSFTQAAFAESDWYVTGGVSSVDIDSATPTALTVRVGGRLNDFLGGELEGSIGLSDDDLGPGSGADVGVEHQIGAYLVGRLPASENAVLLARIGYVESEFDADATGIVTNAVTEHGFSVGVGGEYMFTEQLGIRADYTITGADDQAPFDSIEAVSLSGVFKFGG